MMRRSNLVAHQSYQDAAPKNGKASFLLVDDSEDDILLITHAFEKAHIGNLLKSVMNGVEAIRYLSGEGPYADRREFPLPAVMLLDLKMPIKNGFDVLQWIHSQPALVPIRIIVLTDSNATVDIDRAYQLGACSFIVKPFDFRSLIDLMSAVAGFWVWQAELPGMVS